MASAPKMKANRLVKLAECWHSVGVPVPIDIFAPLSRRPSWGSNYRERSSACPASRGFEC